MGPYICMSANILWGGANRRQFPHLFYKELHQSEKWHMTKWNTHQNDSQTLLVQNNSYFLKMDVT